MSQLGDMMPNHKDHFIFVDICNIVSSCFLELHVVEGAVLTSQWALSITEKYTPTNYKTISYQYSRLGIAYQAKQAWKEARYYLTKAIDTTRLTNEIDEEYIRKLEADFDLIKNRIIDNTQVSMTIHELQPNPGEIMEDFCRRAITEMIACNAEHNTLSFFKSEFERLPNKQTESEVNDEIRNEVSQNLENCVRVSALDTEEVNFIAAQFKNMCMKASPLLPAIIEAALTTIIDRIKDENLDADNEQFISLKQSAFIFSYTDESENYKKGVRVFEIRKKIESTDEQISFKKTSVELIDDCELHVVEGAVLTSQWALNITEKYTPTDYKTISYQYSRLGIAYQAKQAWKEARYYLTKAIDTTRLTNEIDEEYIRKLEADFDLIKNRIIDNTQVSMTAHEIKPNPGENMEDFCRRAITEMIACNAEHSTLSFFKSEFERLPNKQTESEVNDEILNEVSQNLENCVRVSALDTEEVNFIAAQFKNMCMKASPLLPAIIEAALTTIIDRIKDENSDADNEQFISLKQSAFIFSYTDESENYKKGVRVFEIRKKIESNDEQ
ncbi:unnamed protein product [Adineta steineri]|uniref:Uncharacterized protein n=2 Tax=Adineta steineri TaxID=433720 RepID=A0A814SFJ6_9BILA|nr:unnamed protein product [Adineta steineri]